MNPDYELYLTVTGALIDAGITVWDESPDFTDTKLTDKMPYVVITDTSMNNPTVAKHVAMYQTSITVNVFSQQHNRRGLEELKAKIYDILFKLQRSEHYRFIIDPNTTVNTTSQLRYDNFIGWFGQIDVTYKTFGG